MKEKRGRGWCAWEDENGRYFAEEGGIMSYNLYEITKEQYDNLDEKMTGYDAYKIMDPGRHLYMSVDDRCGPPYTIVFDDDYKTLCPWAKVMGKDKNVWSEELTDAAVEIFASEENNREQRRQKRKKRQKEKKDTN